MTEKADTLGDVLYKIAPCGGIRSRWVANHDGWHKELCAMIGNIGTEFSETYKAGRILSGKYGQDEKESHLQALFGAMARVRDNRITDAMTNGRIAA